MHMLRRSFIGLFLMAATFGLLAAAGLQFAGAFEARQEQNGRPGGAQERQFVVNVTEVLPQTIAPVLNVYGEVEAQTSLLLRAASAGAVVSVSDAFKDGARVAAGEVLLQIDPKDADAALRLSKADFLEAQAELKEAESALEIATDDLAAARGQLDLRLAALQRQQDLLGRGVGSAISVETAAVAEASARQSVLSKRQAQANAEAAVGRSKTALLRAEIDLEDKERALGELTIQAPFSGVLSDVTASLGKRVNTNEQIATLIDPSALDVSFRLSTEQYARLLDGQGRLPEMNIEVVLETAGEALVAPGRVTRESASVSEGQTGRQLFAALEAAPGLRPGDFVQVRLQEPDLDDVARVPASAVDASNTVLVVGDENRLSSVPVTVLRRQGDDVLIQAAALEGENIVSERSPLLGAGVLVRLANPPEAQTGPEGARQPNAETTMTSLTQEQRDKLIAFVESNNRMPDDVRMRLLKQLAADEVPVSLVTRLEARMGS